MPCNKIQVIVNRHEQNYMKTWKKKESHVNVNVEDTIFWLSPMIESCNWIDLIWLYFCGKCQLIPLKQWTQRKAATINQLACSSYSLYVQLPWYPMYYPGGMKARLSPVQWSKPYSILAPTQDSNPGGRIQNHKRRPLHYHCTHVCIYRSQITKIR